MRLLKKLSMVTFVVFIIGVLSIQIVSGPPPPAIKDQHNQLQNVDLEWHNGAINHVNSDYEEGDVVPYRYELINLPGDTDIYVTIHYDFTRGGLHAFDFLADYDLTERTVIDLPGTGGEFGDATPLSTLTAADIAKSLAIPDDPSIPTDNLVGSQYFAIGGDVAGTPATGGFTLTGDTTGNSEKSTTLKITTNTGTSRQLAIFWGGHLAIGDDGPNWLLGKGAGSITGAPYHQSVSGFVDANNNGVKDGGEKSIGPGDRAIHNVSPFVIPELPLGPILGLIGMFAAFGTFRHMKQKRFPS